MVVNFNGKEITLNEEDADIFDNVPGTLNMMPDSFPEGELKQAYSEYMENFSFLYGAIGINDKEHAQNLVNKLAGFDEFLKKTVNGKTVCRYIYEDIFKGKKQGDLDEFFNRINRIFGFKINLAELGVERKEQEIKPAADAVNAEAPEIQPAKGTVLPAAFDKAIRDWKPTAKEGSDDLQEIYSFGDFLKDAYSKGLNKDTDLPFLKSAYNTFERYGNGYVDVMMYLKDFVKGKKKTGEDIVRFVADFAHANHINSQKVIADEAEVIKKYNETFKDKRPAMEVTAYDPGDPLGEKDAVFSTRRGIPVMILHGMEMAWSIYIGSPETNEIHKTQLPKEARYEAYVAITGKNDGEIERLAEMFGTGKGLLGGFNTKEYEEVRRTLNGYIEARKSLQEKVKGLKNTGMVGTDFKNAGLESGDFHAIQGERKSLEKALTEYIVKKTKGSDNQIGDVKIEDKTGYGAARLSSAMLLLDIIREEKGGPMKTSDRRKEYTVSAADFKKLYDEERKAKNAGGRRKSSEKAIERYKQDRKQRNAGGNGAAKKHDAKKKPVI